MEPVYGIHRSRKPSAPQDEHEYDHESKRETAHDEHREQLKKWKERIKLAQKDQNHVHHQSGNNPNIGKRIDLDG